MMKIHLILEEDVYKHIWEIVKKRYVNPSRKFHVVVNEALKEYIERHKDERANPLIDR
jgi:metal-responsive CopG/Arc/MetJ family transcriptional regulator